MNNEEKKQDFVNKHKDMLLKRIWFKQSEWKEIKEGVTSEELGRIINKIYQRGDIGE